MIRIQLRGKIYHLDGHSHALRGTLGTKSKDEASYLSSRIGAALSEGPRSTLWTELKAAIPSGTFDRLTKYAGVEPKLTATWEDLRPLRSRPETQIKDRRNCKADPRELSKDTDLVPSIPGQATR